MTNNQGAVWRDAAIARTAMVWLHSAADQRCRRSGGGARHRHAIANHGNGRMNRAGGDRPLDFIFVHPVPDSRIESIQAVIPEAMPDDEKNK
ncbi:hypothetical protein JW933_09100 [candidate division FCPU426 bacterium]|nr:hypothetical protein [candidate division FCPU426 bacterium]